jgi:MYXO-CTERM domain-containing protein
VPQVDVALSLNGTAGSVLFNDVSFGSAASEGYIEVPAGSYNLGVFLGSTLALPVNVSLNAGEAYSVFAMGSLATSDVQAVIFSDPVPTPWSAAALALGGILAARRRR